MISPFCFSKTHETLKAIATEYAKGRLLLMATTHLDALRRGSGTKPRSRPAATPMP
ncbi:MAG: hypothetical protein WCO47_02685 [Methylococcus sp.]